MGRLRRSAWGVTVAALAALVVVLGTLGGPVLGSRSGLSASVADGSDRAGSASVLLTATDGSTSATDCTAATSPIGAATSFPCSGSLLPAAVPSSGTASHAVTIANSGTAAPTSATATAASCGPADLANQTAAGDPMLVRGGVTFDQAGPLSGGGSLQLDGSTGLTTDVVQTTVSSLLGSTFSVGVWFRTAAGYSGGGALLGLGNSASTSGETSDDAAITMNTSGTLSFTVDGTLGLQATGTSSAAYNDGNWHLAVLTVSSVVLSTVTLDVGGTQVASASGLALLTGYQGYWHAGWLLSGSATGYFAGALSDAFAIGGSALGASAVATLAAAASQAAWSADLTSDGVTTSWAMGDSGTTTFAGPYPVIGATSPCSMVAVSAGGTGFCLESPHSLTTSCPAVTASSSSLAAWAAAGGLTMPVTGAGASSALTVTLTRASSYNTYITGLHLLVPVTITEAVGGAPNWTTSLSWATSAEEVVA